ncbi:MAG: SDR family oxidoreductase [Zoogloeaceae bacterium]|jgi:NAD(P)-dependent dehydrogenase (short-subunit alcohol dehydrogenase family)|nr:SDR family oxidoreductase [Zoogloeaceae bacterium]
MSAPDFPAAFVLSGKTILVTGASSGIGAATAQLLAQLGARLMLNGRDKERLEATRAKLSPVLEAEHLAVTGDLTLPETRDALVAALPACDGLAWCAGASALAPFRMLAEKHLRQMFAINCDAPLLLTQQLLYKRRLNRNASLVFVSSTITHIKSKATTAYAAAKAALEAAIGSLALEHADRSVRANVVRPGYVETTMHQTLERSGGNLKDSAALMPLGMVSPEEVAAAIAWLLSDASRWMTRATLTLDGGLTLPFRP